MQNIEPKKKKTTTKGITLISLVITIIVLLILSGITIATLTGDNGILTKANDAKIKTAVGAVKEALLLEQVEKNIKKEKVTPETLLADGRVNRIVQQTADENYYMYYALKEGAVEGMQGLGKGNVASLKDVFLIDDNLNIKYIASNGKEYGDNINYKILEDETEIRFVSKAFSEYVSKISGVSEENMKFKWMKNQIELIIDDSSITNLEDLVFFPNLEKLTLINLNLDNLSGIDYCKKIKSFTINNGFIKNSIKLNQLEILEELAVSNTKIEFNQIIDALKNNKKLKTLKLERIDINTMRRIEELNSDLEKLELRNNKITKIEGLKEKTS
ncbi:MAG: hypothetical protein HFJ37_04900 [Clostridia bacterium]|nr:hypothetical protein [Clostridia bacterium]